MTRSLRHLVCAVVLLLAASSQRLLAQSTMISTVTQTLWTNLTATGNDISPTISNFGQSAHHFLVVINADGGTPTITFSAEASYDTVTWFQSTESVVLSAAGSGSKTFSLEAGGYYPNIRLHTTAKTGSPVISAFYSAEGSPLPGSGELNAPQQAITGLTPPFAAGRASTVTTSVPSFSQLSTSCSSTPIDIGPGSPTTTVTLGCHVYNPNNSMEFLQLGSHLFATGTNNGAIAIPPNGYVNCDFPATGILTAPVMGNVQAFACSSSAASLAAPATPLTVTIYYKLQRVINTSVSNAGTVNGSAYSVPY